MKEFIIIMHNVETKKVVIKQLGCPIIISKIPRNGVIDYMEEQSLMLQQQGLPK